MKYRKRPTEVEAWQVGSDEPMPDWVKIRKYFAGYFVSDGGLLPELFAFKGEWVVKDEFGIEVVDSEKFEQTYEVVE